MGDKGDVLLSDEMANAHSHFSAGEYSKALTTLNEIKRRAGSKVDPKVLHNAQLCEFVLGGCKDAPSLLSGFAKLHHVIRADAKAASKAERSRSRDESGEGGEASGDGSKGSGGDLLDKSLLLYNQAAVQVRMLQLGSAVALLESLFKGIEGVDEWVAMRACFLLLDVYMMTHEGNVKDDTDPRPVLSRAKQVISFLEKPHAFNTAPSDSSGDRFPQYVAEFKYRFHVYKARLAVMGGSQKSAKKELKAAAEIYDKHAIRREGEAGRTADDSGPRGEGKEGSASGFGGDRSGDAAPAPPGTGPGTLTGLATRDTAEVMLKARLDLQRHNYRQCVKSLDSRDASAPGLSGAVYPNNLGCVHAMMGTDRAAALHFSKALTAAKTTSTGEAIRGGGRSDSGSAPHSISAGSPSDVCAVAYNAGISLLRLGRPVAALKSFKHAAAMYRLRPRLWLRMAEACISYQEQLQKEKTMERGHSNGEHSWAAEGIVRGSTGQGAQRRLVLSTAREPVESGADEASWDYAARCLLNVLHLTSGVEGPRSDDSGADGSAKAASSDDSSQLGSAAGLRAAAMCKLAYVRLCLNDHVEALKHAERVIAMPTAADPWLFLAHQYAAEAKAALSRHHEAAAHVHPSVLPDGLGASSGAGGRGASRAPSRGGQMQVPRDVAAAALHVNAGVLNVLHGDQERALVAARTALEASPADPGARKLALYLALRRGQQPAARELLKNGVVGAAVAGVS